MRELGVQPDQYVYNSMIGGALQRGSYSQAWDLLTEMQQHGLQPDVKTLNVFINGSRKDEHYGKTLQLVKQLKEEQGVKLDLITYNSLMKLSVSRGEPQNALEIYKTIEKEGLRPDAITLTLMLKACRGLTRDGKKLA